MQKENSPDSDGLETVPDGDEIVRVPQVVLLLGQQLRNHTNELVSSRTHRTPPGGLPGRSNRARREGGVGEGRGDLGGAGPVAGEIAVDELHRGGRRNPSRKFFRWRFLLSGTAASGGEGIRGGEGN